MQAAGEKEVYDKAKLKYKPNKEYQEALDKLYAMKNKGGGDKAAKAKDKKKNQKVKDHVSTTTQLN